MGHGDIRYSQVFQGGQEAVKELRAPTSHSQRDQVSSDGLQALRVTACITRLGINKVPCGKRDHACTWYSYIPARTQGTHKYVD